jgi:ABC-type phosphate/phosphonate transport system substrate-binding protein
MILTATDSPIREVAQLRGRHVILLENSNCEMSRPWFETLLLEAGMGKAQDVVGRLDVEAKATGALLPVFFAKADACVVNDQVFTTMSELNPQLGRRLHGIAMSEPLIDSVTFLAHDGWESPRHRSDMKEALAGLHETPEGKQILTLFKVDRLAPYEPGFVVGTRALKEKHDHLIRLAEAR